MEIKKLTSQIGDFLNKYRYAILVVAIGLLLLLIPGKDRKTENNTVESTSVVTQSINEEELEEVLRSIHGAGDVKVLLSVASGEETIYQKDTDSSNSETNTSSEISTVLITDSQKAEYGLICQVNPPVYLGAIVVCEGADNAVVKLAITQAVSKITGLGTDHICVLKMN